jgi:uncharacterized OsmC-like protein/predicted DsbA family dithiol-disulfide isomerase
MLRSSRHGRDAAFVNMGHFDEQHPTLLAEPVGPLDHARGPESADVTLVEYGDFACPSCRRAHGVVKDLLARMPEVRFVFRANPRSHLFPDAEPAAEAAEIAAAQGKFWQMHDRLFEGDEGAARPRLVALARELGLDVARFEADLDGRAFREAVRRQEVSGWHSHVLSTPTFFVNGVRFDDSLERLPEAVARATRLAEPLRHVFREASVRSTESRRRQLISVGRHEIVADLPVEDDGGDAGPGPYDLLLAALGACTAMTVQWAADKHHLPLDHVEVRLTQSRTTSGHLFRRSITLAGDLTESHRAQLQHAAEACPVAKTLTHGIAIETRASVDRRVDEADEESFPASDAPPWTTGR